MPLNIKQLTMENFLEKMKAWIKSAGLRSVGYLGCAFIATTIFGMPFLAGVGVGVFLADNWVTIKKLATEKFEELI